MNKGYKNLIVWNKSKDFCVKIYKLTEKLPKAELYGLTSQLRRASVSIPSNIAEGSRRNHKKEQIQFYTISYGSGSEIETQLEIVKDLFPYLSEETQILEEQLEEIMKMLNKLIFNLQSTNYKLQTNNKGVAALPAIIVIAMVILLVGVGISSTGFIENLSSYGELENKKALAAAEAGAADGFEKLVRNRSCSGTCANYTIVVGDADADVVISDDTATTKKIISTGRVGFKRVKIQVIVLFDANGKATQDSWQEITD